MLHVTPTPEYSLLSPDDADGFAQMLALFQDSIEVREQKTADEIRAMQDNLGYRILVTREGQRIIAFAIVYFPSCGSFWLLEYLAVDPSRRSQRYGESTFQAAKRLADAVAPGAPCVLEVDQPEGAFAEVASRRLRFYRRLGCRRLDGVSYILPLDGAGPPPPMWLLVQGIEDREFLTAGEVLRWLQALYVEVYGLRADDARISAMLSRVDAINGVGLVRLF